MFVDVSTVSNFVLILLRLTLSSLQESTVFKHMLLPSFCSRCFLLHINFWQEDRDLLLLAVTQHGWLMSLPSFPKKFRGDRELVLAAVKADGIVLECATLNLRHDLEVVHAAVNSDWEALRFADDSLRDDKEVNIVGIDAGVYFAHVDVDMCGAELCHNCYNRATIPLSSFNMHSHVPLHFSQYMAIHFAVVLLLVSFSTVSDVRHRARRPRLAACLARLQGRLGSGGFSVQAGLESSRVLLPPLALRFGFLQKGSWRSERVPCAHHVFQILFQRKKKKNRRNEIGAHVFPYESLPHTHVFFTEVNSLLLFISHF